LGYSFGNRKLGTIRRAGRFDFGRGFRKENSMITDYTVVRGKSIDEVEKAVKELIRKGGWEPVEGIKAMTSPGLGPMPAHTTFFQTMVRASKD
jgi:hypothetical protein